MEAIVVKPESATFPQSTLLVFSFGTLWGILPIIEIPWPIYHTLIGEESSVLSALVLSNVKILLDTIGLEYVNVERTWKTVLFQF